MATRIKKTGRSAGAWVITGGASGFGREFARRLAERGERLVLWGRDEAALEKAAAELGGDVYTDSVDVRDAEAVVAAAQRARDAVGLLGHVANCAGVLRVGPAEEMPPGDYELMMGTNYLGSVHVTQALLPHLEEAAAGGGRATLLLVSSISGLRGFPQLAGYCASKFAVMGFAEALRVELHGRPISVRVLCPPPGDTPMVRSLASVPPVYKLSRTFTAEEIVDSALRGLEGDQGVLFVDLSSRATRRLNQLVPGVLDRVLYYAGKR
jgi:NAD(P)-dependent dehydrogenase (short-subunit alcohol dehydrogenase family)